MTVPLTATVGAPVARRGATGAAGSAALAPARAQRIQAARFFIFSGFIAVPSCFFMRVAHGRYGIWNAFTRNTAICAFVMLVFGQ